MIASWPQPAETQELLERAGNGDDGAVNELFACHRAAVRRMISFQMDRALAQRLDDIDQDVMVEASRRLSTYLKNPTMPFHLWPRQLARDHIIAAHRSVDRLVRHHQRLPLGEGRVPAFLCHSVARWIGRLGDHLLVPEEVRRADHFR